MPLGLGVSCGALTTKCFLKGVQSLDPVEISLPPNYILFVLVIPPSHRKWQKYLLIYQWNIRRYGKRDGRGQTRGLREHVEITAREVKRHGLLQNTKSA